MKKTALFLMIYLAGLFGPVAFSAPPAEPAVSDDPGQKLMGEWIVAGKFGTGDGEAVFRPDKTYILKEIHPDGIAVTHKGEYRLDPAADPCAIDLCVGKFSNAGSEWVTTFGILRFISDDEAEIHFDPSGNRPASFDSAEDKHIHKMTRKK
jgi:hypothetical protein